MIELTAQSILPNCLLPLRLTEAVDTEVRTLVGVVQLLQFLLLRLALRLLLERKAVYDYLELGAIAGEGTMLREADKGRLLEQENDRVYGQHFRWREKML